jgi:hypothetical protein
VVQVQPRQKVSETPSPPTWHGGIYLSSQLCRRIAILSWPQAKTQALM